MLDEVDAIFASNSSDRNEGLRSLLNSGIRAGAAVSVCVGQAHDVKRFSTFCPKVLAGIDNGWLPETIRDRCIEIRMQRKTSSEGVERFRHRKASEHLGGYRDTVAAWGKRHCVALHASEPEAPEALNDRMEEAWEPLLAIADLAGGGWPRKARDAAMRLSADDDTEEASHGTRLLAVARRVFGGRRAISTQALLKAINADDEMRFGGWSEGRGIDSRALSRLMKPYGITPRTIRFDDGTILKGYRRDEFVPAWIRYLPSSSSSSSSSLPPSSSRTPGTPESDGADRGGSVTSVTDVTPATLAGQIADADADAAADAAIAARRDVELWLNGSAPREIGT